MEPAAANPHRRIPATIEQAHQGVPDALNALSDYPEIVVGNFAAAVDAALRRIDRQAGAPARETSKAISQRARRFHLRVGTLTPAVDAAIKRLAEGSPVLLFAHQPIAFAYDGVTAQHHLLAVLQEALRKQRYNPVLIHLLMDTDDSQESYFRTSRIPAPNTRIGTQSTPLPVSVRHTPMYATRAPRPDAVAHVLSRSYTNYLQLRYYGRSIGIHRVDPIRFETIEWIERVSTTSESLALFNAAILSLQINVYCGYDTIFVPYSEVLPSLSAYVATLLNDEPAFRVAYLSQNKSLARYHTPLPSSPLYWLICASCRRRYIPLGADRRSRCPDCGTEGPGPGSSLDELCALSMMTPRVSIDDVLLGTALRSALAVSYISSAEHIVSAGEVIARYTERQPHLLWRPRPVRNSLAELIAVRMLGRGPSHAAERALHISLSGRGSLLYSLMESSSGAVAARWSAHFGANPSFGSPCFLESGQYGNIDPTLLARLAAEAVKASLPPASDQQ